MQSIANKYLKIIDLVQLENWSVQGLLDSKFNYSNIYEQARIGDFLIRSKNNVNIEDDKEYNRITVKINNNGVILRDTEKGVNIGTKKQYRASAGQFIISKIDARNGAFGIIPNELHNAIVTNDFPLFDVNTKKINPQFLLLITTTKVFIKFAQSCSSGTTNRQRMDIEMFLNQKIPLPSLPEQEAIVNNYYSKIKEAEGLEKQANDLEGEFEKYLFETLGYKLKELKEETNIGKFLRLTNFLEIGKWGVDQILSSNKLIQTKSFKVKKIYELCTVSSGGTPSRDRKEYYTGNIPWVKTGEVVNDIIFDTEEKITEEAIANSSAKIYPKGSLIIAMYGQGLTRGRTAKLGVDASTNQACAVLSKIDNNLILTDFLWIYLIGEYHRLREMASGNNQPNLNAQMLKDYQVIIPPLQIQFVIIDNFNKFKTNKLSLLNKSNRLKSEAEQEFEQTIFKP